MRVSESSNSTEEDIEESLPPTDTLPFSVEGIQTVVKGSLSNNECVKKEKENTPNDELLKSREENVKLRAALKEAASVNQQWRNYHDERQNYVQKLLATIQTLEQDALRFKNRKSSNSELELLKKSISRQQMEHEDSIQLLQLQVKAHRDDWDAERCEKNIAEAGRQQAETKVTVLQRQLQLIVAKLAESEVIQQNCRCGSVFLNEPITKAQLSNDLLNINGYFIKDGKELILHGISSSSRSRSSSISTDISSTASPSPTRCFSNAGMKGNSNYHKHNSISPVMTVTSRDIPVKSSTPTECVVSNKSQENQLQQHEFHSAAMLVNGLSGDSANTTMVYLTEMAANQKKILASRNRPIIPGSSKCVTSYYESKGARPKSLPKGDGRSREHNNDAKHRARSILASALPVSPSNSAPSSPVNSPFSKCANASQNMTENTPFVFAHPSTSTPLGVDDHSNSSAITSGEPPDKADVYTSSKHLADEQHNLKTDQCQNMLCNGNANEHDNVTRKNIEKNIPIIKMDTAINEKVDEDREEVYHDKIILRKDSEINAESGRVNRSKKEHHKLNDRNVTTNYTSITVLPGLSSTLHSQSPSTTSSRSSSPGISLMTFALNSDGQAVPGAIYFALGSELKGSSKVNTNCISVLPAITCKFAEDECKTTANICTPRVSNCEVNNPDISEKVTQGRLINSTWVQLMDKEKNKRSNSGIPWRTARAVPSIQINSNRKTFQDDISNSDNSLSYAENKTGSSTPDAAHIQGSAKDQRNQSHKNLDNNTHCEGDYGSSYHTSFSPSPNCFTCAYSINDGIIPSNLDHRANSHENRCISLSPTTASHICCRSCHSPSSAELDLKSLASKNIASAILSYEHGSKTYVSNDKRTKNVHQWNSQKRSKSVEFCECSSKSHICPSCEMLFSCEQIHNFKKHMQLCGGPKYFDM